MSEQPEMAPDIIITPIATRGGRAGERCKGGERCEVGEKRLFRTRRIPVPLSAIGIGHSEGPVTIATGPSACLLYTSDAADD